MSCPYRRIAYVTLAVLLACAHAAAQPGSSVAREDERPVKVQSQRGGVRTVTIPITIRAGKGGAAQQELQPVGFLTVREDGEEQKILSIRALGIDTPISVGVLIQDDLPSIGNEIKAIKEFVGRLPRGSRVMIGYIRSGSLDVRQRFTADLERASSALRVPVGSATASPFNPYVEIIEGLRRFEAMPKGRRALLVVSDGLDISRGVDSSAPSQSIDLQRAIKEAQRQGVAVYSFYAPSVAADLMGNQRLIAYGQGSLEQLSDDTGGRAFFQGTGRPVSFDPFLSELAGTFTRQLALTYLSTHPKKGFHKIQVTSEMEGVEVDHPAGYTR